MTSFLKNNLIAVLLFGTLCSSVIYVYAKNDAFVVILFSVISFIYSFGVFYYLDFLRKRKNLVAAIGVIGALILTGIIGLLCLETGIAATLVWFMDPGNMKFIYRGNIAALVISPGFILASSLYYFSAIRYRAVFVFLICMCPFSIFAKTFTDIPSIYIILISTLFFILMITKSGGNIVLDNKNSLIAFGSFIIVVTVIASFMPKLETTPYREQFDELITGMQIGQPGKADYNEYSNSSALSTSDDDETIVFYITGDNPVLIKRQCFDKYDRESSSWKYNSDGNTGYNRWYSYTSWEYANDLTEDYGKYVESRIKSTVIHSADMSYFHALYTPQNMTMIEIEGGNSRNIYRNIYDEYFIARGDGITSRKCTITWCECPIDEEFSSYYDEATAKALSDSGINSDYYKSYQEMCETYDFSLHEDIRRDCYKDSNSFERVHKLTDTLTENCSTDYEKAKAIESYFRSELFVYDKNFNTADSSIEHFIFDTRRGICTQYATAMALLCREAGLYSRYVEGFRINKQDDYGNYYVTSADSHAYVQVWIDGYGWTDFDPTSGNTDNGYFDKTFIIFGSVILVIGIVLGIIVILIPIIKRKRFLIKASKLHGGKQAVILYPELNRYLHKKLGLFKLTLTVSELKKAVYEKYETDISELADAYERAVYGGFEGGNEDYLRLYKAVENAVKTKERTERKKKR